MTKTDILNDILAIINVCFFITPEKLFGNYEFYDTSLPYKLL